ncbi:hypothetical protein BH10BAC2_BH10BAC2_44400 [soil metagenome]
MICCHIQENNKKVQTFSVALFFCFFIFINFSNAQNNTYRFENITSEQGLTDRLINVIVQDNLGYIWIGSAEGLTRYDGYSCVVYRHKANDKFSLSDNEVYALCLDNEGALWIGTHNGLNRYDAKNDRFDVFQQNNKDENSIGGKEIFSLAKDASGNIWIGTLDGGLDVMVKKNNGQKINYLFTHYRYNAKDSTTISNDQVLSICFTDQKNGWIGTASGLNLLNLENKTFTRFYHNPSEKKSISNNVVSKICKDSVGDIWLCGNDMLDKVSGNAFKNNNDLLAEHYLPALASLSKSSGLIVNDFTTDAQGNKWVATNDNGLIKFNTSNTNEVYSFEQFTSDNQSLFDLANSTVYSLYKDRSDVLWIGTAKGVSKYIPSKTRFNEARHLTDLLPKHKSFVMALLADQQNRLWIGYDSDTLSMIRKVANGNPVLENIPLIPFSKGDQVNTLFQSRAGDIYIGTLLKGLYIIPSSLMNISNRSKWIHIDVKKFPSLPSNNIYAVAEDLQGMVWIGTYTGLCRYNPVSKSIEAVYTSPNRKIIEDYIIRAIAIDEENIIWCGTDNGVYLIRSGKVIQSYKNSEPDPNTISNNGITSLLIDHDKNTWIGTKEGLNLYNASTKKIRQFNVENGLSNDGIKSIKEDTKGNIWIATNHGLSRFAPFNKKFYRYTTADGLYADQFIANASTTDSNSIFYFGTNSGLISFKPENIIPNTFIPPVVITGIKILNIPIASFEDSTVLNTYKNENKIVLNYNQNFFSFEFAALNYINSAANKYAYQLEGIDKVWNQAGTKRFADYTDIKPGSYTFKVKAANNDGVWNEVPATVTIVILSPWWQTWWFYTLCTVITCAVVYTIYRIRLKQILKFYKLRSSIAKDLHDDVGSALSSIALLSNIAQSGKTNTQLQPEEIFSRIGNTSKKMIDLMDDIVWSVNPDNDRFSNMLIRMREYAVEMLETKNIDFTFKVSESIDELKLPMQMRKDYFLIFKESLNNLTKYAEASTAAIIIEKQSRYIITTIQDNGKGFDPQLLHSGNGLKNMKERATAIKASLNVETGSNGTKVTLTIPVT